MPVILLLGLVYSTALGNIICVNATAPGSDGSSWGNAFSELQAALNVAVNNDQIWVAAGNYTPTSDYGLGIGARGKHFRMINGVAICGGFPNTGNPVWADRDPDTNATILSGDLLGNDTPGLDPNELMSDPSRADNCYHVFYHPLEAVLDATAVLDGFTITGGNSNDVDNWPYDSGGGMYNEYCNPTVTNCTFSGNTAFYGGGMGNYASNPTVMNCTFSNNSADGDVEYEPYGGGMDNYYSNPLVFNCLFDGNSAVYGGGMNNLSSSPFVMDCTFSDNTASGSIDSAGGGMSNFLEEGSGMVTNPTVTDCVFSGNSAVYGGGMENEYRDPAVTDCLFSGNTADDGGGMFNFFSSPTVTECAFNGNTALYGGGMSNEDSNSLVINCVFSGNLADFGGGMDNLSSSPLVTNCSFSGNAAFYGGGMDNDESNPILSNSILWGNTAISDGNEIYNDSSTPVIAYSNVQSGLPTGSTDGGGNIDADPLFVDADGADNIPGTEDDDLQLQGGSPCIDAADGDVAPTTDLLGNPRINDPGMSNSVGNPDYVDIGAYESQDPCTGRDAADFDCNGIVNMVDFIYFGSRWLQ